MATTTSVATMGTVHRGNGDRERRGIGAGDGFGGSAGVLMSNIVVVNVVDVSLPDRVSSRTQAAPRCSIEPWLIMVGLLNRCFTRVSDSPRQLRVHIELPFEAGLWSSPVALTAVE
ncbi:hypothetical protein [Amycolatopsis sp. NPDC059657]|uniref:hypothetical protein n=1 Tax=Amycolatopsis sp. NPDC059657 TaxID=3346899 RepID=UPI003671250E